MASFVGRHNLLNRLLFSCLHRVFPFTFEAEPDALQPVRPETLSELLLNLCLFGLWSVDLTKAWLPLLPATDASASYGFGMCTTGCDPALNRWLAGEAARGAHHVRVFPLPDDPPENPGQDVASGFRLPWTISPPTL